MKQAEDTATMELPHMGEQVITLDNQTTRPDKYRFFIYRFDKETGGAEVVWNGLTKKQARDMYAYTNAHQPSNVVACGWEIMDEGGLT
jgi:hypothetical protein